MRERGHVFVPDAFGGDGHDDDLAHADVREHGQDGLERAATGDHVVEEGDLLAAQEVGLVGAEVERAAPGGDAGGGRLDDRFGQVARLVLAGHDSLQAGLALHHVEQRQRLAVGHDDRFDVIRHQCGEHLAALLGELGVAGQLEDRDVGVVGDLADRELALAAGDGHVVESRLDGDGGREDLHQHVDELHGAIHRAAGPLGVRVGVIESGRALGLELPAGLRPPRLAGQLDQLGRDGDSDRPVGDLVARGRDDRRDGVVLLGPVRIDEVLDADGVVTRGDGALGAVVGAQITEIRRPGLLGDTRLAAGHAEAVLATPVTEPDQRGFHGADLDLTLSCNTRGDQHVEASTLCSLRLMVESATLRTYSSELSCTA